MLGGENTHVDVTDFEQILCKVGGNVTSGFIIGLKGNIRSGSGRIIYTSNQLYEIGYKKSGSSFINGYQLTKQNEQESIRIWPGRPSNELLEIALPALQDTEHKNGKNLSARTALINGFLQVELYAPDGSGRGRVIYTLNLQNTLSLVFHIPGLRTNPKRTYTATSFREFIKGPFDLYVAGTISQWQKEENSGALELLNINLRRLGLTDSVTAKVKNANEVELSVSRLPAGSKGKPRKADMVNIADVGIGVSQVLPILVALIAAQEGQLVYMEQPELHLHPRAQVAMAELLAEAANRGVRVIVETHSSLLLLTVQTLVAEAKIKPEDVALHWFSRDAKGATTVRHEQPDENGAYGDWPEDFGDVEMTAQRAYLDAVTKRRPKRPAKPTDA